MQKAKERWSKFCALLEADPQKSDEVFEWLNKFYSEKNRHYHNWTHILSCLDKLDQFREKGQINLYDKEIEYAIWFHDVVYSCGLQKDDEEASAKLACLCAEKMDVSNIDLFVVSKIIIVTKDHEPDVMPYADYIEAQNIMCDIDLSIFSEEQDVVDKYDKAIRAEYFWVPDADFANGRSDALKKYLYRHNIYFTNLYQPDKNIIARNNLSRLIKKYGS